MPLWAQAWVHRLMDVLWPEVHREVHSPHPLVETPTLTRGAATPASQRRGFEPPLESLVAARVHSGAKGRAGLTSPSGRPARH